jgi:hypothetical protein
LHSCDVDNSKFQYSPQKIYAYSYESSFYSLFDGTDNLPSDLHVTAEVHLTFPSKCQGHLKVMSVKLKNQLGGDSVDTKTDKPDYVYEGSEENFDDVESPQISNVHPRSDVFARDVEKSEIRFAFNDGRIGEICQKQDEPTWVTNFKRGIISMLQNTMERFDQDVKTTDSDVSGKCRVEYQFLGSLNTSIEIQKKKDIPSCQNRNKFKSIIQTTPYSFGNDEISWWPIYSAKSSCKVKNSTPIQIQSFMNLFR